MSRCARRRGEVHIHAHAALIKGQVQALRGVLTVNAISCLAYRPSVGDRTVIAERRPDVGMGVEVAVAIGVEVAVEIGVAVYVGNGVEVRMGVEVGVRVGVAEATVFASTKRRSSKALIAGAGFQRQHRDGIGPVRHQRLRRAACRRHTDIGVPGLDRVSTFEPVELARMLVTTTGAGKVIVPTGPPLII